jgi:hypothetical protein
MILWIYQVKIKYAAKLILLVSFYYFKCRQFLWVVFYFY